MDKKEQFIIALEQALNELPEEAINILKDPKYSEILENSCWELIPRLYAYLTNKNRLEKQQIYHSTEDLILEIARIGNSEDLLFEFIEQAEKQNSYYNFILTLKALKITLLRLPQRRGVAIGWCCSAILRYISGLNFYQNEKLDGEEQLLLENDSNFHLIEDVYLEVVDFFLPFVKEIEENHYSVPEKHVEVYKDTILKSLLKLFGHPLTYSHLERGRSKSAFRVIAENVLNFVVCFHVDLLSFLDYVDITDEDCSPVDCEFNNASLGVFYYLILVEGLFIEKIPCVYSNVYLLKKLMWLCMSLIKCDVASAQWKGLSLAENALSRISDKEIVFEEANRIQCKKFAEHCTRLMIFSETKRNRVKAVTVFQKFLRKFDPCGRYYMLLSVQDIVTEPGFVGYLATRSKDFIAEALTSKNVQELKYFSGKCLRDLIKKFCRLEDGSEIDLMRYADQIISCLNLLRFLIIRDSENCTGFLELIPYLNNNYLTPLKKAIELSRAHYELQKRDTSQCSKIDDLKTSIVVGGLELPQLSDEEKFQILDRALNMFDLIESILSRVIECIYDRSVL